MSCTSRQRSWGHPPAPKTHTVLTEVLKGLKHVPEWRREVVVHSSTAVLTSLGFSAPNEVGSLRTIAHLFGAKRSRTGVYALLLPNDRVYIGKSTDVVARFAGHRRNHEAIEAFAFQRVRLSELDDLEQSLIRRAEQAGLRLTNVTYASNVVGERDLDLVVPEVDQARWLANPFRANTQERADVEPIELPEPQVRRYAGRLERLRAHPNGDMAIEALAQFLAGSVPFPRATEYSFWTVSCLPSTATFYGQRLLCVHAAVIELFAVCPGGADGNPAGWGFVNVATDVLMDEFGYVAGDWMELEGTRMFLGGYREPGDWLTQLVVDYEEDLVPVLRDPRIQRAAAALALRMMRKRPTIFQRYHCKQLADAAHAYTVKRPMARW
jgi:hypothetical protein